MKIKFNSNRSYSFDGQKIAGIEIDGGVFMVDISRGITAFFKGCELTENDIMSHYDHTANPPYAYPSAKENWIKFNEVRFELENFAQ